MHCSLMGSAVWGGQTVATQGHSLPPSLVHTNNKTISSKKIVWLIKATLVNYSIPSLYLHFAQCSLHPFQYNIYDVKSWSFAKETQGHSMKLNSPKKHLQTFVNNYFCLLSTIHNRTMPEVIELCCYTHQHTQGPTVMIEHVLVSLTGTEGTGSMLGMLLAPNFPDCIPVKENFTKNRKYQTTVSQ